MSVSGFTLPSKEDIEQSLNTFWNRCWLFSTTTTTTTTTPGGGGHFLSVFVLFCDAELCGGARRGRLARDEVRRVSRLERSGAVIEAKFVGEFYQISVDYGQFARVRERADQSGQEENI